MSVANAKLEFLTTVFYEDGLEAIQRAAIKDGYYIPYEFFSNLPEEAREAFKNFVAYLAKDSGMI